MIGRLHFAGEHTSLPHAWMEAAVKSGLRVALEVQSAEGPKKSEALEVQNAEENKPKLQSIEPTSVCRLNGDKPSAALEIQSKVKTHAVNEDDGEKLP